MSNRILTLSTDLVKSEMGSKDTPSAKLMLIEPETAESILRLYNIDNRTRKPQKVLEYAQYMSTDQWVENGETIKFSDRRLLDGQNRLAACIKANKSFRTWVIFRLEDISFDTIDVGKDRNASDLLKIAGYKNCNKLAAATKWVDLLTTNNVKKKYNTTHTAPEVLRLVQDVYPDLPDYLHYGSTDITKETGVSSSIAAALAYVFLRLNREKAELFFERWETKSYWRNSIFHDLSKRIEYFSDLTKKTKGGSAVPKVASVILAWNFWVSGKKYLDNKKNGYEKELSWNVDDEFPIPNSS